MKRKANLLHPHRKPVTSGGEPIPGPANTEVRGVPPFESCRFSSSEPKPPRGAKKRKERLRPDGTPIITGKEPEDPFETPSKLWRPVPGLSGVEARLLQGEAKPWRDAKGRILLPRIASRIVLWSDPETEREQNGARKRLLWLLAQTVPHEETGPIYFSLTECPRGRGRRLSTPAWRWLQDHKDALLDGLRGDRSERRVQAFLARSWGIHLNTRTIRQVFLGKS